MFPVASEGVALGSGLEVGVGTRGLQHHAISSAREVAGGDIHPTPMPFTVYSLWLCSLHFLLWQPKSRASAGWLSSRQASPGKARLLCLENTVIWFWLLTWILDKFLCLCLSAVDMGVVSSLY